VIFRMVQEALTNVERHAKASSVVVELREAQERIEIRVQDNGIRGEASRIPARRIPCSQ